MPFVDGFCNQTPGFGQGDMAVPVHQDMPVAAQIFHGDADTGLGKSQLIGDINGAYIWLLMSQH